MILQILLRTCPDQTCDHSQAASVLGFSPQGFTLERNDLPAESMRRGERDSTLGIQSRRLELTEGIPSSNAQTLDSIKKTLESAGVEFLGNPEDGAGVRFKPRF